MTSNDERIGLMEHWLREQLGFALLRLEPASADASFRRYFRAWNSDGETRVIMDAPPEKEATGPFLKVAAMLASCGVHVPRVQAADTARGFLLLEDLGSEPYLTRLRAHADPEKLYGDAMAALLRMQLGLRDAVTELPPYDRSVLEREMALMPEWFCTRHLQLHLDATERALLEATFAFLSEQAVAQPIVFVHRDFHSRNLMYLPADNPGVIDFQDALAGPVGYDLVSLLKDCYVEWPRQRVEGWVSAYRARLRAAPELSGASEREFLRWFDLMGVQRHIKVLGIFARLWYRDGKSGYLPDLPRTLGYVQDTVRRYAELREFDAWLEQRVMPVFAAANARALGAAS